MRNDNPFKPKANLAEHEGDDTIVAVVSRANIMTNLSK